MNLSHLLPRGFFPILSPELCRNFSLFQLVDAIVDAEISLCVLREPEWPRAKMETLLQELHIVSLETDLQIIVHGDIELATQYNTAGVHLNALSPPPSKVRKKHGKNLLIGYSAHSLEEALRAQEEGADYLFLGAVFPTPKKDPHHPLFGVSGLSQIVSQIRIPIYAIGGITEKNLLEIRQTGARGFTVLRELYGVSDPDHLVQKWQIRWEET